MKLYVAGYRGKGFGGALIKRFTFGDYSHVSFVFEYPDGALEEIESIQGKGVHSQEFEKTDKCDLFLVECTDEQIEAVYDAANSLIGCKYDWTGIWGFFVRKKRENPNKWFCSELVSHCLAQAGIILQNLPSFKQNPVIVCASTVIKKEI